MEHIGNKTIREAGSCIQVTSELRTASPAEETGSSFYGVLSPRRTVIPPGKDLLSGPLKGELTWI